MSLSRMTVVPISLVPPADSTPEAAATLLLVAAAAAQQKAEAERIAPSTQLELKPAVSESGE